MQTSQLDIPAAVATDLASSYATHYSTIASFYVLPRKSKEDVDQAVENGIQDLKQTLNVIGASKEVRDMMLHQFKQDVRDLRRNG